MRSLLLAIVLLLGCLSCGALAQQCRTETDFSFANINMNGASHMHFMSSTAAVDKDTGSVTLIKESIFDFRHSACVQSVSFVATGPFTIKTLKRNTPTTTTTLLELTSTDTVAHPDDEKSAVGCSTLSIHVIPRSGTTVTIKEIRYCTESGISTSRSVDGSRGRRSVDDETAVSDAPKQITIAPVCNSEVANNGKHVYCYAVFSYDNPNEETITISHNNSYFVGAPNVNMNPTTYYPGLHTDSLMAFWQCDEHLQPALRFILDTPIRSTASTQRSTAVMPRNYIRSCPEDITEWIDAEDVPDMFATEDD